MGDANGSDDPRRAAFLAKKGATVDRIALHSFGIPATSADGSFTAFPVMHQHVRDALVSAYCAGQAHIMLELLVPWPKEGVPADEGAKALSKAIMEAFIAEPSPAAPEAETKPGVQTETARDEVAAE